MNIDLTKIIEALLFSSDKPLSVKQIKDIINEEKEAGGIIADIKKIETSILKLVEKYNDEEYSFRLIEIAGAYRFATKSEYSTWLVKLNKEKLKRKLSQVALETLAIIAYKQPTSRPEIESIKGGNVDYIVGSLLEKNLITIKGRADAPGRPILYGTTNQFLEYIGLNSLEQLPPLKDISDIIKTGPPDGITQSDIDFYEEINLIKNKLDADKNHVQDNEIKDSNENISDEKSAEDENINEGNDSTEEES